MSLAMVVASKAISRNVARNQVTSQKMILIDRISLLPQGPSKMNFASTLPQTEAEFFDEKGLLKDYNPQVPQQHTGSMFILKKVQGPNNAILLSEDGVEIQHNTSTSVSDPDPAPILSPDFPFQEFPLTEVVNQSQKDSYSIFRLRWFRENAVILQRRLLRVQISH